MEDTYEIFITRNGTAAVTGETKNAVLNAILSEPSSLAKIVSVTKLPKSTVFSILNKFLTEGLIQCETSPVDNSKVYSSDSVRLMSFRKPEKLKFDLVASRWGSERNIDRMGDISRICFITFLSAAEFTGVDLMPLFVDLGSQIGKKLVEKCNSDCIETVNKFLKISQLADVQSVEKNPFSISVIFPTLSSSGASRVMGGFIASIYTETINGFLGTNYKICSLKISSRFDGCHFVIKDGPGIFQPNNSLRDISFKIDNSRTPSLYISENGVQCVSGLQEKILITMSKGKTNLADIAASVDAPVSTVSFNLDRMGKMNLVKRNSNGFVLCSIPCMSWKGPNQELIELCDKYIANIAETPEYAYRYMVWFIIVNAMRLGMDNKVVLYNTARSMAKLEYDSLESPPLEDMIDYLKCSANWTKNVEFTVIGFRPFKINIRENYDMDRVVAETKNAFYGEFFCELLKQVYHGIEFAMTHSEILGDGNRRHIIQIEAIVNKK